MKTINFTLVLLAGILIINACQKDSNVVSSSAQAPASAVVAKPAAQKMSDLAIKPSFDCYSRETSGTKNV